MKIKKKIVKMSISVQVICTETPPYSESIVEKNRPKRGSCQNLDIIISFVLNLTDDTGLGKNLFGFRTKKRTQTSLTTLFNYFFSFFPLIKIPKKVSGHRPNL